jgi:hypothetical protein
MSKYRLAALFIALAAITNSAQAEPKKGPNGGAVVTVSGHPIEFVLKGQEIVFYMSDYDGSPLQAKEVRARATVQDGGKTATVPLQHAPPNILTGTLQAPLGPKARVVLSATLHAGGHSHTLTARYVTD